MWKVVVCYFLFSFPCWFKVMHRFWTFASSISFTFCIFCYFIFYVWIKDKCCLHVFRILASEFSVDVFSAFLLFEKLDPCKVLLFAEADQFLKCFCFGNEALIFWVPSFFRLSLQSIQNTLSICHVWRWKVCHQHLVSAAFAWSARHVSTSERHGM